MPVPVVCRFILYHVFGKMFCIKQLAWFSFHLPTRLLQLCQRTMALPVGRGMFTLFSYHPVPTEQLPIPKLNLTGRAPPRNTTVDLNSGNIDVPPNMACWASFHNGVAAGLKIAPASQIDSAWIVYNKPKIAELANEYAGFLMALGLNGHLTKLATLNIHDYLTK
ncbi:PREDICTED: anaphase-promoting complex subunit 1-like, partial [Calidris pugnax]|uniref:anaphase-promoting complex subunit 1-like n=1 Tax=Calidris pugnax TaxID=198806 RepID=UPI00071CB132